MTQRKENESPNIWDAHEWPITTSAYDQGLDSGQTQDDVWDDGAEWSTESPVPTQSLPGSEPVSSEAPAKEASPPKIEDEDDVEAGREIEPVETTSEDSTTEASEEVPSGEATSPKVVEASTPDDDVEETTEVAAAPEDETAEAPEDETAEAAVDSSSGPNADFVLDSVRNEGAWGKSDEDWEKTEWDQEEEVTPSKDEAAEDSVETTASKEEVVEETWVALPQPAWISSFEGRRGYALVFVFSLLVFSMIFGKQVGKVSTDPHYVLLADAFLKKQWSLDSAPKHPISGKRMTNDWAHMDVVRVTRLNGKPLSKVTELRGRWRTRNGRREFATLKGNYYISKRDIRENKRVHFVSFPPLPAYLMMGPMFMLGKMGYDRQRFSDISFTLFFAALAVLLLFWLLQSLSQSGQSRRTLYENIQLTALFGFGSVFFFVATRGTVWFTALVIGVCCSLGFLLATHKEKPFLAGVFVALGFLTRPLLILLSLFYFWKVIYKKEGWESPFEAANFKKLVTFALPVGLTLLGMMMFNQMRFGAPMEFGHAYLPAVFGRVEAYGLFHKHWIPRNFYAFFLATPDFSVIGKAIVKKSMVSSKISLMMFVQVWTTMLIVLGFYLGYRQYEMRTQEDKPDVVFWVAALAALAVVIVPLWRHWVPFPVVNAHGLSLFITTPALLFLLIPMFNSSKNRDPWFWGLIGVSVIITIPLLMYQNTGWLTFGKRFSMDYMPLLIVALATSGIVFGRLWKFLLVVAIAINTFGAISFGFVNKTYPLYQYDIRSLNWIYDYKWIKWLFS